MAALKRPLFAASEGMALLPGGSFSPGDRRLRKGRREADVPQTPLFTAFAQRSPRARVVREKGAKTTSREKLFRKPLFLRET